MRYISKIAFSIAVLNLCIINAAQSVDRWDLTILHTNSINGALDNCG